MAKTRAKATKGKRAAEKEPVAEEVTQKPTKRARVTRTSRNKEDEPVATSSKGEAVPEAAIGKTPVLSEDVPTQISEENPVPFQEASIPPVKSIPSSSKDTLVPAPADPIGEDDESQIIEPNNEPRASDLYLDTVCVTSVKFFIV